MTAKSETVGVLYVCYDKNMERRLFHMRETAERHTIGEIEVFVPESALAELAERHAATERNACLMAELANDEKNKRLSLMSGLEALAGRWDAIAEQHGVRQFTGNDHKMFANELRSLIPAAANTESEEVKS